MVKFYVYPLPQIPIRCKWDYDYFFAKRWITEAYQALLKYPNTVSNPDEADFFVVSFTLASLSFVYVNPLEINKLLLQLPYWNDGKKHIVFDFTDSPYPIYNNKNLSIFKSAFDKK